MSDAPAESPQRWHLTATVVPRLTTGGFLVLAGLLLGRADVAALGVPIVLTVVWGLVRRPPGFAGVDLAAARFVSDSTRVESMLTLPTAPGVLTGRLRVSAPGHRDREAVVDRTRPRDLRLSFVTARTGRQDAFLVEWLDRGANAVLRAGPRSLGPVPVVVVPRPGPLGDLPLPHRLQGLTGSHRSRQPGDGGELRDVAMFAAGDRLRRIDWKATARRAGSVHGPGLAELYVRRTYATADAHVVLVVDARDAVGPDVDTWDDGNVHPHDLTSLDLARRAATSVARRFLDRGDRVGLVELGGSRRRLRPAGGQRHLDLIAHQLALAGPDGQPAAHGRTPEMPRGALIMVFSTFLDDHVVEQTRIWRFAGHRTIAVDVTPVPLTEPLLPRARTAHRLVRMQRHDRLAALESAGVEVVSWDEAHGGSRVALAALSRARRSGR